MLCLLYHTVHFIRAKTCVICFTIQYIPYEKEHVLSASVSKWERERDVIHSTKVVLQMTWLVFPGWRRLTGSLCSVSLKSVWWALGQMTSVSSVSLSCWWRRNGSWTRCSFPQGQPSSSSAWMPATLRFFSCLFACLSLCLSVCPSCCLPLCLSSCLIACLLVCLLACFPASLSAFLSFCLHVSVPACQSVCLCTCSSMFCLLSSFIIRFTQSSPTRKWHVTWTVN